MSIRVLIAEDDSALRQGLCDLLEGEGYEVEAVENGRAALDAFHLRTPDLLLLDVMMPELSGFDVCRTLRRENHQTPVIMLTAKGEEIDKVVGLELGADDYVTKPFGLHELRARIAAVLRRSRPAPAPAVAERFSFGAAQVDPASYRIFHQGEEYGVTAREMQLLEFFRDNPHTVHSRNHLLNAVWGVDYFGTTRTLDQHIAQLRKKIEPEPATPRYLLTVHGVGYRYLPAGEMR
mgnify:CR=1 FL=1